MNHVPVTLYTNTRRKSKTCPWYWILYQVYLSQSWFSEQVFHLWSLRKKQSDWMTSFNRNGGFSEAVSDWGFERGTFMWSVFHWNGFFFFLLSFSRYYRTILWRLWENISGDYPWPLVIDGNLKFLMYVHILWGIFLSHYALCTLLIRHEYPPTIFQNGQWSILSQCGV